ncbi:3-deoxy-manno-octulosonate cytidylyltransferase [Sodalis sp. CWE]|uniref:3-deoxy-manno-octulosonate cytidylyltransferase n=1 Tax=Sodalis sp. CWE TaxID=2803816 RepID=UPI001C7DA7D0|nr:3-deoxy-manno-octulosonate cytidylyltransferase [Sodalis sp. CWE]MBX4181133.1 3-deoxy-manno-octulosonate cytidylyltransferase [Sodalis sp. CWE]
MSFIVIIPARFAAIRLPGKPLIDINGKPMVVRVMEQAQASGADRVIVATDHMKVIEAVHTAGGEACLTSKEHLSGTERLREVIDQRNFPDNQIIVNVQGDEPFISPKFIRRVANDLIEDPQRKITTLAVPITTLKEASNPNIVKVVVNSYNYAIYFSRSSIPWSQKKFSRQSKSSIHRLLLLRHIGIYSYRVDFIRRYVNWSTSPLEKIEKLEQLRILWYGEKIYVAIEKKISGVSVNTASELEKARLLKT